MLSRIWFKWSQKLYDYCHLEKMIGKGACLNIGILEPADHIEFIYYIFCHTFNKLPDWSIFEEVFPSKRTKMFFGKISTYTCIQVLKFRIQALFFMQNQNLKSDFRFFDFLLFLGIKSETNHYAVWEFWDMTSL